jgi:class 3 adenylate cyclase
MKIIKCFQLLLVIQCIGFTAALSAQQIVTINKGESLFVGENIEYFIDTSNRMNVKDVLEMDFSPGENQILNFGNLPHHLWLRISVETQTEFSAFLELAAPLLSEIELYQKKEGDPTMLYKGGFLNPFKNKEISSENWIFNLDLDTDKTNTFYLKVFSIYPLLLPVKIATKEKMLESNQMHNLFWGLYIGIMIFAFLYNFFIYLSLGERTYLYYLGYILGSVLFYLGLQGFPYQFLWPDIPVLNLYIPVIICLTNIVITLFTLRFLNVSKKQKVSYYWGWGLMVGFVLIAIVNLAGFHLEGIGMAQGFSMVAALYYIYTGVSAWRRGVPTARFFLLAWTLFLLFVMIYLLTINNVLPSTFFTTHCIFIGHMTEVLLLSFALADRINWLKRDNERKQREIIHQLKENDMLQVKVNMELEQKVAERTAIVEQQKADLEEQKKLSDELLLNILPEEVADELKKKGFSEARLYNHVTVLFTDFVNFTGISQQMTPTQLVEEVHKNFTFFDAVTEKYSLEKIKTIGDAYLAVCGLPNEDVDHAAHVLSAALEIRDFVKNSNSRFLIRIGVHSGPVVAGIVGVKKYAYDIWGDTVNTAARLEQTSEPGKINVSGTTYDMAKDKFLFTYRGQIEAKNKGDLDMYFLESSKEASGSTG